MLCLKCHICLVESCVFYYINNCYLAKRQTRQDDHTVTLILFYDTLVVEGIIPKVEGNQRTNAENPALWIIITNFKSFDSGEIQNSQKITLAKQNRHQGPEIHPNMWLLIEQCSIFQNASFDNCHKILKELHIRKGIYNFHLRLNRNIFFRNILIKIEH